MKNLRLLITISFVLVCVFSILPSPAHSGTYTFSPSQSDLGELDHNNYYKWGIKWNLPSGETITGATLTYKNIYDWTQETDHLYTHLLDKVKDPNGPSHLPNWFNNGGYSTITITGTDNEGGGDKFTGKGLFLGDWHDPGGGFPSNFDLVYTMPASHFSWLSDGNFGFGIDPDCHYYNDGITFNITTTHEAPEPATMFLLGSGLIGLAALARRKFKK
jgi:hypothetical protein